MKTRDVIKQIIKAICSIIPNSKVRRKTRQKILIKFGLTDYLYNRKRYNIGEFSYIGKNTKIVNEKETTIGKYCSISHEVLLGLTQHPTNALTTHGFICHEKGTLIESAFDGLLGANKDNVVHFEDKVMPPITIGNDVWIGYRAIIMDGVKIGDGAIVAAGAVVTKDVEPYTIVAGVPTKPVKKRFDSIAGGRVVPKLLELRWWDYPPEFVQNLPFADIEKCIEILEKNKHLRIEEGKK